ncbi:hypothetical protein Bbelb_313490 [Branchiostoma belcheri]|nr:hypothetical protein Bbelb_313490 [Branchiostoma belcheri]
MPDNRIPKVALSWRPEGKRKRGRPKTTWRRTVSDDLAAMGLNWRSVNNMAQDRPRWRKKALALCLTRDKEDNFFYEIGFKNSVGIVDDTRQTDNVRIQVTSSLDLKMAPYQQAWVVHASQRQKGAKHPCYRIQSSTTQELSNVT